MAKAAIMNSFSDSISYLMYMELFFLYGKKLKTDGEAVVWFFV